MPREHGRRSFLAAVGASPTTVSSREWIGLQKRIAPTFTAELGSINGSNVWGDDDGFLVGDITSEGTGLARIGVDGQRAWHRPDITGTGRQSSLNALARTPDGGYAVIYDEYDLLKTDPVGRPEWRKEFAFEGELEGARTIARTLAVAPDGSIYVAGSVVTEIRGGMSDETEPWIRKYTADGRVVWVRRPTVEGFASDTYEPSVPILEARSGGVRVGFAGTGTALGELTVFDVGANGTVRDRWKREVDAKRFTFRPAEDGYLGLLETESDSTTYPYDEVVRTDESFAVKSRMRPAVPGQLAEVVRLDDGDFVVASRVEDEFEEYRPGSGYLSRVAPDGSTVWRKRTDGYGVGVADGRFATIVGDRLVAFAERDGGTLDPVLGLAGVGLGLLGLGVAAEGLDDE